MRLGDGVAVTLINLSAVRRSGQSQREFTEGTWATTLEAMELDGSFANGAEACCDTVQNITCRVGVGTRQHPTFDSAQTLCDAPDTLNG